MGKLGKAFRAIGHIFRHPWLLNHVLNDETVKERYVARKYGISEGLPTIDLSEILPEEGITIDPYAFLDGGSLPSDLALLKALCIRNHVEDYLEIGTWRGESVANVASVAPNCVSINLEDIAMRMRGISPAYINMHRFFSEKLPNVDHIQADSHYFDYSSLGHKFDLIFIDGDHHSESIAKDTVHAFDLLKDERSVIVWHDYGMEPETPRYETLAGILDGCPTEARKHLYHVSNTLCAIYTKEPLKAKMVEANERPEHYFSVQIRVKKILS